MYMEFQYPLLVSIRLQAWCDEVMMKEWDFYWMVKPFYQPNWFQKDFDRRCSSGPTNGRCQSTVENEKDLPLQRSTWVYGARTNGWCDGK